MNEVKENPQSHKYIKPTKPVEVVAMEMVTPVGVDALQTISSVTAGISAYQSTSHLNRRLFPMTMALVPDDALPPLEDSLSGEKLTDRQKRILQLASLPVQYISESYSISDPIPLLLAGPEKMHGEHSVVSDRLLSQLQMQTKQTFDLENSYVFPYGRSGGLYVIEAAMSMLELGVSKQVMIGAVDTFLDMKLLGKLDAEERILSSGIMDGFAPAEGAAFMILQSANENTPVKIYPPGISNEQGHRYSKEPYLGDGLSSAVREALQHLVEGKIQTVLAGFNGESFNAKEWGVSVIRNNSSIHSDFEIIHPADCMGDSGAAMGLILAQLAILGLEEGIYSGPILAWCSSDYAQRSAICIARG